MKKMIPVLLILFLWVGIAHAVDTRFIRSVASGKKSQTITWGTTPSAMTVGDADQTLTGDATASSGLTITYTDTADASKCTIVAGKLHAVAAGTCVVHADQAGNGHWFAAPQVTSGNVTISAAGTTVAYDAVASGKTTSATTSIASFNLTIGAGVTNGAVAIGLSFSSNAVSAVSVTVGGVAAAVVTGTDSGTTISDGRTMIYCLATGSTHGAQAIAVSWTGSSHATAGSVSASGVNQTTPCQNGTFAAAQITASGTTPFTLVVTSATGDMTFTNETDDSGSYPPASPLQTVRYGLGDSGVTGNGSTAAGAATVTDGWSTTQWVKYSISGIDFKHN